jgi:S1-C subfamily serine protease
MFEKRLRNKVNEVKNSIIAIGFVPAPNQITIVGSGFCVSDSGKILSAAHLYNQLKPEHINKLTGMASVAEESYGLTRYTWLPLKLLKKDDKNDVALFQLEKSGATLIKSLSLGDSESVEVGDDAYFIGFPYAAQLINDGFGITLVLNKCAISNVKRDGVDPKHPRNFLVVDAISNPGNSGCPLIDLSTNKVIGIMSIAFRTQSKIQPSLDIREPMHIGAAKPINLAKELLAD